MSQFHFYNTVKKNKNLIYKFDNPLSSLSGMFDSFGKDNLELDKLKKATKEELKNLSKSPNLQNVLAHILSKGLEGLRKDLDELSITDPKKREEYEKTYTAQFNEKMTHLKLREISASPESKALDNFVGDYRNYSGLDAIIKSAKPKGAADKWATRLKEMGLGSAVAFLIEWYVGKEAKNKKASVLDKRLLSFAALLNDEKSEKDKGEKNKNNQAVADAEKDTTKKNNEKKEKKAGEGTIELLSVFTPPIDDLKTINVDYAKLTKNSNSKKEINDAIKQAKEPGSNFNQICEAAKESLQDKSPKMRLIDVFDFEQIDEDNINAIVAAIKEKKDPKTPDLRTFFNDIHENNSDDIDTIAENYKKEKPTAA